MLCGPEPWRCQNLETVRSVLSIFFFFTDNTFCKYNSCMLRHERTNQMQLVAIFPFIKKYSLMDFGTVHIAFNICKVITMVFPPYELEQPLIGCVLNISRRDVKPINKNINPYPRMCSKLHNRCCTQRWTRTKVFCSKPYWNVTAVKQFSRFSPIQIWWHIDNTCRKGRQRQTILWSMILLNYTTV